MEHLRNALARGDAAFATELASGLRGRGYVLPYAVVVSLLVRAARGGVVHNDGLYDALCDLTAPEADFPYTTGAAAGGSVTYKALTYAFVSGMALAVELARVSPDQYESVVMHQRGVNDAGKKIAEALAAHLPDATNGPDYWAAMDAPARVGAHAKHAAADDGVSARKRAAVMGGTQGLEMTTKVGADAVAVQALSFGHDSVLGEVRDDLVCMREACARAVEHESQGGRSRLARGGSKRAQMETEALRVTVAQQQRRCVLEGVRGRDNAPPDVTSLTSALESLVVAATTSGGPSESSGRTSRHVCVLHGEGKEKWAGTAHALRCACAAKHLACAYDTAARFATDADERPGNARAAVGEMLVVAARTGIPDLFAKVITAYVKVRDSGDDSWRDLRPNETLAKGVLCNAVGSGEVAVLTQAIEAGFSRDSALASAMTEAIGGGGPRAIDMVRALLRRDAVVTSSNVILAIYRGTPDVLDLLLTRTNFVVSASTIAAAISGDKPEMLARLLGAAAHKGHVAALMRTFRPVDFAIQHRAIGCVKLMCTFRDADLSIAQTFEHVRAAHAVASSTYSEYNRILDAKQKEREGTRLSVDERGRVDQAATAERDLQAALGVLYFVATHVGATVGLAAELSEFTSANAGAVIAKFSEELAAIVANERPVTMGDAY